MYCMYGGFVCCFVQSYNIIYICFNIISFHFFLKQLTRIQFLQCLENFYAICGETIAFTQFIRQFLYPFTYSIRLPQNTSMSQNSTFSPEIAWIFAQKIISHFVSLLSVAVCSYECEIFLFANAYRTIIFSIFFQDSFLFFHSFLISSTG